jgi:lipoprotein-releasing system permease protein
VKDKSEDIAILRTMGATRGAMLRVFEMVGASIGVVGTLAGLGLGLLITTNIQSIQRFISWLLNKQLWDPTLRFLSEIPAEVNAGEVGTVMAMSFILSLLSPLYPSWRAARLDPVQALRYG